MKVIITCLLGLAYGISFSQVSSDSIKVNEVTISPPKASSNIGGNGFNFKVLDAGVNTKYSEIGTDIYRDRLVLVSSKKIGGAAKIDPNTNEAYTELFCADISENGSLSRSLLFSRVLNTKDSEGHLAFSQDQQTVYYTRSDRKNSLEFKLYKANLQECTSGIWINHTLVSLNRPNVSIETPFINKTGNRLYFSSNMPGGHGGFDLYVSEINIDGTLGTPINLGSAINTDKDEKYPALSLNSKDLFFSSKGHENTGGYDVFKSSISDNEYSSPINLGATINTPFDEIAYFLIANNIGYVSSNRSGGNGSYDIFTVTNIDATQTLSDNIIEVKNKQKNTTVAIK